MAENRANQTSVGKAFASLGFLVGLVTGLTSSSVAASLLGLVFALLGGSTIAFFDKLEGKKLDFALQAILAMSIACVIGLGQGIAACEWQLLSPPGSRPTADTRATSPPGSRPTTEEQDTIAGRKYLRSHLIPAANAIDMEKQNGEITVEKAYEKLYAVVQNEGKTP
jgi:hypothetical protein